MPYMPVPSGHLNHNGLFHPERELDPSFGLPEGHISNRADVIEEKIFPVPAAESNTAPNEAESDSEDKQSMSLLDVALAISKASTVDPTGLYRAARAARLTQRLRLI